MTLDSKAPSGPIETRWERHCFNLKLVNPANKRKHTIIVVGSGLAGASAAASLAELGYQVLCFCFQDSPRRAHSIAAQGGMILTLIHHDYCGAGVHLSTYEELVKNFADLEGAWRALPSGTAP